MQIWAIGTTRNEVDLVAANVRHHLAQGVDRFLLLDNDSTDGTRDVLSDLSRTESLIWSPYTGEFRQDLLLTRLAHEAFDAGAEWVLPVDADEFWHGRDKSLRAVLERHSDVGALRVDLVNFVQHRDEHHTRADSLLRMTRRVAAPIGPFDQAEELVESERIAYVEHQYHYKWISRRSPTLRISWGNHVISGARTPAVVTSDVMCYHAPLRSFSVLEAKVDGRRPPEELEDYFAIAWHLRRWRRLAWEGRLDEEWWGNSYLDDHLDLYGQRRPLVRDTSLRDMITPWLSL
jgi:hypothetical protein